MEASGLGALFVVQLNRGAVPCRRQRLRAPTSLARHGGRSETNHWRLPRHLGVQSRGNFPGHRVCHLKISRPRLMLSFSSTVGVLRILFFVPTGVFVRVLGFPAKLELAIAGHCDQGAQECCQDRGQCHTMVSLPFCYSLVASVTLHKRGRDAAR